MGAVDRLVAADVLATYVGRPAPFGAFEAMAPAVEMRVDRAEAKPPPRTGRVVAFPTSGQQRFFLYPPAEAVPASLKQYGEIFDGFEGVSVGGTSGDQLRFSVAPDPGAGDLTLRIRLGGFHPQMGLMLTPPGASVALGLRRPVEGYAGGAVWCRVVLSGAMRPAAGVWTMRASRLILDDPQAWTRIDEIWVE
jgi:hypothetical protein